MNLSSLVNTLFFLSISSVFISGIRGNNLLGELSYDLYVYFNLFASTIFILINRNLKIPKYFNYLVIFVSICVFSYIMNFSLVTGLVFKNYLSDLKFINQLILVLYFVFVYLILFNFFVKKDINISYYFVRNSLFFGFIVNSIYAIPEFMGLAGYEIFSDIIDIVDSIIRDSNYEIYRYRLRGTTFEAPALGALLVCIVPFVIHDFIYGKRLISFILMVLIFLFTYATSSRIALVLIIFQIIIFPQFILRKSFMKRAKLSSFYFLVFILIFIVDIAGSFGILEFIKSKFLSISLSDNSNHLNSNIARLGSFITSLKIWISYPVIGCGFGMYGYYMKSFVPSFALMADQVQNWVSNTSSIWPPTLSLYARLLAETGILGLASFIFWPFKILKNTYRKTNNDKVTIKIRTLWFTTFTIMIYFIQYGSFKFYLFYVILAVLSSIIYNEKKSLITNPD